MPLFYQTSTDSDATIIIDEYDEHTCGIYDFLLKESKFGFRERYLYLHFHFNKKPTDSTTWDTFNKQSMRSYFCGTYFAFT